MLRRHPSRAWLAIVILAALPACKITWREPTLQPLNTNRFYAAELSEACQAARAVVTSFGLEVTEMTEQERACLVDTDFKVLADDGDDPTEHLNRVAFTGAGRFIGGRYTVTVTGRGVRDGGTRVKVVTRVEGYINEEFGYQVLRSTGLLEERMFADIGQRLGVDAQETR